MNYENIVPATRVLIFWAMRRSRAAMIAASSLSMSRLLGHLRARPQVITDSHVRVNDREFFSMTDGGLSQIRGLCIALGLLAVIRAPVAAR